MTAPDLTGVVLAGGDSTRFEGGDKALATLDDRPLLAHVVAAVREATGSDPVVVTPDRRRRRRYAAVLDGVRFARDERGFDGPLAGALGGLAAVETEWAFVCGCDMPGLSPRAVRWLAGRRGDDVDAVTVLSPDGVRESLHALYRVDAARRVGAGLPATAGPQALLDELTVRDVTSDPAPAAVDLATSLANVNTRADLRSLE